MRLRPVLTPPDISTHGGNPRGRWGVAKRTLGRCAILAALPLLSGCVAAAIAVPAMTVAGALTERKPARPKAQAATTAVHPAVAENTSALSSVAPEIGAEVEVTSLTELPAPTQADIAGGADDPWRDFVSYALERGAELGRVGGPGTEPLESALLAPEAVLSLTPQRRPCGGTEPAVIIDLDHGPAAFFPENAGLPSRRLAEGLSRLRDAGIVVLWISSADANRVSDVADVLRRTGLDPQGRDPLLLVLKEDDRKQTIREEANEDVCVLAIAGDRRADFDELFDYLLDPDAAAGLEKLIGSGWFIVPPPVSTGSG